MGDLLERLRALLNTRSGTALTATLIGSAPGLLLPFAITAHFGAGRATDAYFFALSLALFGSSLASAVIETNVLPALQVVKRDRATFEGRVRVLALQSAGVVGGGYLLVAIGGSIVALRNASWSAEEQRACLETIAVLSVFVVAVGASSVYAAALYTLDDFRTAPVSLAIRSLIPAALLLVVDPTLQGIVVIAGGVSIGESVRFVFLRAKLRRRASGLPVGEHEIRALGVWRVALPHAFSLLVVGLNPVIDRTIAATLAAGSVTLLDLGEKVFYIPFMALTSSLVVVAGVRWAQLEAESPQALARDWRRSLTIGIAAGAVCAVGLAVPFVLLTLASGETFAGAPSADLRQVTLALLAGLPSAVVVGLGARFLVVTRQTRYFPLLAIPALTLNVVGDIVGAQLFEVTGIALSSTVVRTVNAGLYIWLCGRYLRRILGQGSSPGATTPTSSAAHSPR